MNRAGQPRQTPPAGEVIDFDAALLHAFSPEMRSRLMSEAALLAQAFAPEGRAEELELMARTLSAGEHDGQMDRKHARGLAAALHRLARDPSA